MSNDKHCPHCGALTDNGEPCSDACEHELEKEKVDEKHC